MYQEHDGMGRWERAFERNCVRPQSLRLLRPGNSRADSRL